MKDRATAGKHAPRPRRPCRLRTWRRLAWWSRAGSFLTYRELQSIRSTSPLCHGYFLCTGTPGIQGLMYSSTPFVPLLGGISSPTTEIEKYCHWTGALFTIMSEKTVLVLRNVTGILHPFDIYRSTCMFHFDESGISGCEYLLQVPPTAHTYRFAGHPLISIENRASRALRSCNAHSFRLLHHGPNLSVAAESCKVCHK